MNCSQYIHVLGADDVTVFFDNKIARLSIFDYILPQQDGDDNDLCDCSGEIQSLNL
jgi:hypothetical protein